MANPLWLMMLRTAWKVSRERFQEVAVNLRSHLSEMNMKGYIHSQVSEIKDCVDTITSKTKQTMHHEYQSTLSVQLLSCV